MIFLRAHTKRAYGIYPAGSFFFYAFLTAPIRIERNGFVSLPAANEKILAHRDGAIIMYQQN